MPINKFFADKINTSTFQFEDRKLTVDCLSNTSRECPFQLNETRTIYQLYLKGFVFDEENVKIFSDTFSELQDLIIDRCNFNDELSSLLTLPPALKSIRLELPNLSMKGIQSLIDKLSCSLESLEIIGYPIVEFLRWEQTKNLASRKVPLNLAMFSSLKNVCILNLGNKFDVYHLLLRPFPSKCQVIYRIPPLIPIF